VSDAETSSAQAPQAMKEEAKAGNKKQDLNFRATKFYTVFIFQISNL